MPSEGFIFIHRDRLSCNSLLLKSSDQTVLIDSGYATQSEMLTVVVNIHLESQPFDRAIQHSADALNRGGVSVVFPEFLGGTGFA